VGCVMHTHTTAGVAVACQAQGLLPISQFALQFYNRIGYHGYEGIALLDEEKPRLVNDLGTHGALILRNHGLLTCYPTIAET
ncbi:class II aldolase/adducin family protein, partial [Enterococcus faecalis]|uniref:class II aldolase/adducin family protein n=1 Tax=Enterococcus faecalis TaxID=1351 RepID=UPI00403F7E31